MEEVKVKVTEEKGTGYLPDMGALTAQKRDTDGVVVYVIADDNAGTWNGTQLKASQVELV